MTDLTDISGLPGFVDPGSYPMGTRSGAFFPFDPDPEDVRIEDIARSLSRMPRYLGHTERRYTVLEHSLVLAEMLMEHGTKWSFTTHRPDTIIRAGMPELQEVVLHDAAEAYSHDLIVPLKRGLNGLLQCIEDRILDAIFEHFDLSPGLSSYTKFLDFEALLLERKSPFLFPDRGSSFCKGDGTPIPNPWAPIDEAIDAEWELYTTYSLRWIPRIEPSEEEMIEKFYVLLGRPWPPSS